MHQHSQALAFYIRVMTFNLCAFMPHIQECVAEEHRQAVAAREERLEKVEREKEEQEQYVAQLVCELEHLKLFSKV